MKLSASVGALHASTSMRRDLAAVEIDAIDWRVIRQFAGALPPPRRDATFAVAAVEIDAIGWRVIRQFAGALRCAALAP
jgi:hypothetical protein